MVSVLVDDTDPRFDYKDNAWTAGGQSGEFDSTHHSTSTAGAVVQFGPFTGTSIAVFSTVGTSQPKIHFFVDGGDQNSDIPARSGSSVQFQQQLYSASNLDPTGNHTLNINVLDAGPFTLDYILIGGQSTSSATEIAHPVTTLGSTSVANPPTTTVGGIITSSSGSSVSDITPASILSFTSIPSAPSSSSGSSTTIFFSTGPGANPSSPIQNSIQPTPSGDLSSSASSSGSAAAMGTASTSGLDAIVIGSVTGSIVFFAIVVVSVVLLLRRRRRSAYRRRSTAQNKSSGWPDSQPKHRPSLHPLSIPSPLSLPRGLHRPSLLPTHSSKSIPTSNKPPTPFGTSHPAPSFLAEDPNDSPVFDIKQRPVSGATMTTRVTVGTTIDQRVSVPDSVYRYQYSEAPEHMPIPPMPGLPTKGLNSSPTETSISSAATGSAVQLGFGLLGTNPAGTLDTTVFSGYSENGNASGVSASRPLPSTPAGAKRAHTSVDYATSDYYAPQPQSYPSTHRYLPTTPSGVETVVHQDAGVRLASNVQTRPRKELPPPYQDYGI